MVGAKVIEWHDAQETGFEARLHEYLFATVDCLVAQKACGSDLEESEVKEKNCQFQSFPYFCSRF
jgi:hypothetical protein